MHVSLENFFNDISPELLETADDMLQNGQLVSLTKTEEDWYCGEVAEGSQEYQVGFKISPEGFISNLRCDCPD
ncbi:hypothetical protein [Persicobacter diffluens]|uniref:SH3 domain-containing protein n=1 Tax=Persicobacter diffluens TaxID=981 RepID=A0AAN4W143_9BACT|nr:hypothetical protein PEDI_25370 [Persicobacter diffluens]